MATNSENLPKVTGIDFSKENEINLKDILESMDNNGGQATEMAKMKSILRELIHLRETQPEEKRPLVFIGYTSNMISSGIREILCYMAKNKHFDVAVTTAGGIEEDFIKCTCDTKIKDWYVDDIMWRVEGKCRIGNMVIPANNYKEFEEKCINLLEDNVKYYKPGDPILTPSKIIEKFSEDYDNDESVCCSCYKNGIKVFCPGFTDGALGDNIYFQSFNNDNFVLDINQDLTDMVQIAVNSKRPLAAIILGGSIPKYHVLNAFKMAGGADYYTCITSNGSWDMSQSGAEVKQDISRGAIKKDAKCARIIGEAVLLFSQIATDVYGDFGLVDDSKNDQEEKIEE